MMGKNKSVPAGFPLEVAPLSAEEVQFQEVQPQEVPPQVEALIQRALEEDLAGGDLTTERFISPAWMAKARLIARSPGILAGLPLLERVFSLLPASLSSKKPFEVAPLEVVPPSPGSVHVRKLCTEGCTLHKNQVVAELSGPAHVLLMGERTALNFISHLSGIATFTHQFVQALGSARGKIQISETRKTLPGWRALQKYAVRLGGGTNHRRNLGDGFLVKDNHLILFKDQRSKIKDPRTDNRQPNSPVTDYQTPVTHTDFRLEDFARRFQKAQHQYPDKIVQIEVKTLSELRRFLALGCQAFLLDNMPLVTLKKSIYLIRRFEKNFPTFQPPTCKQTRRSAPTLLNNHSFPTADRRLPTNHRIFIEVSGGITLDDIPRLRTLDIDRISIGALTHSVPALNFSLEFSALRT